MRKEMLILGLTGLLGCDRTDVSKVESNVYLVKPEDCQEIKDLRYLKGSHAECRYQVFCVDVKDKLVLYDRPCSSGSWRKIEIK